MSEEEKSFEDLSIDELQERLTKAIDKNIGFLNADAKKFKEYLAKKKAGEIEEKPKRDWYRPDY